MSNCYYCFSLHFLYFTGGRGIYAEYYYEAWTTSTADPNGPRVSVDTIEMYWKHGETRGHEIENNVTMVAKTDKTINLGCDDDTCVKAFLSRITIISTIATTPLINPAEQMIYLLNDEP